MIQPAGLGLGKGCSVGVLTRAARQVHLAVMAAFAETGRAPARGELERSARTNGADPAAVLAELAARDVIVFGADGEIRAAYPFSPVPTSIQVRWAGGPLTYAMCAIDALGISAMLGRPVTARHHSSGWACHNGPTGPLMPALLMRMSTVPSFRCRSATAAAVAHSSVTSATAAAAMPPA